MPRRSAQPPPPWKAPSARLRAELAAFDPTLAQALDRSARKIKYQIEKMERKTAREAMRRDERAARDADSLCGLIYPERHLQERLYGILPFLAKHGLDLPATSTIPSNSSAPTTA